MGKIVIQCLLVFLLIAAGLFGFQKLQASRQEVERSETTHSAPVLRTMTISLSQHAVKISGEGTVRPVREITLVPEVGGKVLETSEALVDGGVFKKGDVLVRVDPVDYQLALATVQARVKDYESKLRLAEEEAAAAQEEWRIHASGGRQKKPPALVAKEPQLAAAKALLASGRAELKRAELNLARTVLKAPFDGRCSRKMVDTGQYIVPGQSLATLYSTEAAEIAIPLADEDLFWFHVPGFTPGDGPGAMAAVRAQVAGRSMSWPGRVVRAEGLVDEKTRTVGVVVRVDGPYERKPPLAAGLFVQIEIEGRQLDAAAIIPRSALRDGDTVWVVDDKGILNFRKVEVALIENESVYITGGLTAGEIIGLSNLKAVIDGMEVRPASVTEENES